MKRKKAITPKLAVLGFKISIDDGYCEYTYRAAVDDSHSIRSVWKKIASALKVKETEGELRTKCRIK